MAKKDGASKNWHVVPREDGWAAKREGAKRASKTFKTKGEAVDYAREKAHQEGGELTIHGRDGRIQDKDSYGNDPNPPKDTKH